MNESWGATEWVANDGRLIDSLPDNALTCAAVHLSLLGGMSRASWMTHERKPPAMTDIHIGRYSDPAEIGWQGWIEPTDLTWIAFIDKEGKPVVFLDRDPETGAVRQAT